MRFPLFLSLLILSTVLLGHPMIEPPLPETGQRERTIQRSPRHFKKQRHQRKKPQPDRAKFRKLGFALLFLGAMALILGIVLAGPAFRLAWIIGAGLMLLIGNSFYKAGRRDGQSDSLADESRLTGKRKRNASGNGQIERTTHATPGMRRPLPDFVSERARRKVEKRREQLRVSPVARRMFQKRREKWQRWGTDFERAYRSGRERSVGGGILMALSLALGFATFPYNADRDSDLYSLIIAGFVLFALILLFVLLFGLSALFGSGSITGDAIILYEDGFWTNAATKEMAPD